MVARGALGSLLVLPGALVGATLPASTPLLRLDALVVLRDSEVGRILGLTVVMVGLGILAAQWLRLCRTTASAVDTSGSDDVDALALVRRAAASWSLPLLVPPPLCSRDGWSYAAQGALVHAGLSPYGHGRPRSACSSVRLPQLLVVWHRLLALHCRPGRPGATTRVSGSDDSCVRERRLGCPGATTRVSGGDHSGVRERPLGCPRATTRVSASDHSGVRERPLGRALAQVSPWWWAGSTRPRTSPSVIRPPATPGAE